jgi:hypothetical protein
VSDRPIELFDRFVAEWEAGRSPDPAAYVADAGADGEAVSGVISAYLALHLRRSVPADEVLAMSERPELAPAQPWSVLLPDLRARRGMTRTILVQRLAERLGVGGAEEQVGGYVHELEAGLFSPRRVQPAVVDALAAVLSVPRSLLAACRAVEPPPLQHSASTAFARSAPAPSIEQSMFPSEAPSDPRVDKLFTGGADG